MATTLNTVARSNLRASKGKYILTGIGIAISSFFIAAIMMLTNSLQATVNSSVGDVLSRAEAVVASAATTSDGKDSTSIYLTRDQIQKVEKSDLLSGYWVQYAVTGSIGTGDQKTPVQYNQLPADSSLFPYKVQGKIPSSDHEIMVSTYFAKKHNLSLNGKVTSTDVVESVSAPGTDKTAEYTVVGLFDPGFEGSTTNQAVFIGGTSLGEAALKAAEAENKSSAAGYRSMAGANLIYLKFKDGVTDAKLKSLQDTLSSGDTKNDPRVMTGQKLLEDYQKSISTVFTSISVVLGAFAALALLVSSFVISNTFAVLVGQRIRELALLRTLGARGGSLVRMLLIESITVGVVFSLIGALLTYPVGALVGANLTTIMISYSITPVIISTLLCTIVTVLASLSPARSALR
ncbi:ABC transporter permease, partial [Rothia mucilaginosa]|uniref:ABC transporter permease n=1 Tax=Rothia mucilaginosa TaxID=43675 RepID=UPI003B5C2EE7